MDLSNVTMHSLQPYDTSASLGYITTLAMAFVPAEQVDALSAALNSASSNVYNNPDASTKTLMSLINPMIPILAGAGLPGNAGSSATASGAMPGATANAAPLSDSVVLTPQTVRTSSAAIGAGVVAGAAAYGAAMFYIAHRYRRNKRSHRRSSSVQEGPALAGTWYGSRAGSYHDIPQPQQPPVMSEIGRQPRHNVDTWFSRGSGGSSNAHRSIREAGISAPFNADNSLGWH